MNVIQFAVCKYCKFNQIWIINVQILAILPGEVTFKLYRYGNQRYAVSYRSYCRPNVARRYKKTMNRNNEPNSPDLKPMPIDYKI